MTDQGALVLRPIQPSDDTEWRRLWRAYLTFYETQRSEAVYASSFQRLLSEDPGEFQGRLALLSGRAVGLVHFLYHRHMWSIEACCYLQDLYVDPDSRGHGIGRALIEAVYDQAARDGLRTVYWLTQEFNAPARALYDKVASVTPFIRYQRSLP